MITFKRVAEVAVGDPVTSADVVALADAVNDRIKSGLGDPTARIHFYLSAMQRQIRNPDSGGTLFPAVDEARRDYEHLDPSDGHEWPLTGPGEPEGTNVASILGAYVFGSDALGLDAEDQRLAEPTVGGVDLDFGTGTARELWELAKRQRGAIDTATGAIASPVFNAAKSHFSIIQSAVSQHGNAYGGYLPVPEDLSGTYTCADGTATSEPSPHVQLIFSPLKDGLPTLTFEGYCPEIPTHVAFVLYFPNESYWIVQFDGTITVLSWEDYIEGPYTFGNRLTKTYGNHLSRVLNFHASEYKGTQEQRDSEDTQESDWLSHAFTTHEFLTTQYHLAPQRGQDVGGDYVDAKYPQWQLTGATSFALGTTVPRTGAGSATTFATASGFLTTGCLLYAQKLAVACTIEIRDGTELLKSVTLTPDATGLAQELVILPTARAMTALKFVAATEVRFTTSGSTAGLLCEATELWQYKPRLHDLSLFLRLTGFRLSIYRGTDGSGEDEDQANEIGTAYFERGCIVNQRLHIGMPGSFDVINQNAIYDAARRYGRQCSRVVPRNNLVGYEVGSDGKSVLHFRRLWNDVSTADVFDGIGPSRTVIASGSLKEGRTYIVSGSNVTYNGTNYVAGATVTAVAGVFDYTGGQLYEYNGIESDALKGLWSNEWVMDVMSLIPYSNLDTSVWKTGAFTDYVSMFFDRCTFEHPSPKPKQLTRHFHYNVKEWVAPESLPAFRYTDGINALPCGSPDPTCEEARRRKLRSCPIGKLPLVVESVTAYTQDGEERVRVKLNGRLQHGSDAPSTVDLDYSTWSLATIQAEIESGRTDENGIREYLINQFVGGDCVGHGTQYGNAAHNSTVHLSLDVPNGSCHPRIAFTKLVPKPYNDDDTDMSDQDTPMESWWYTIVELYARAMVEGYVDGVTTEQYGCDTGTYAVLDYSFESACFQAFGGRAFGCIQSAATELAPEAETRPDGPLFHGPLPNTYPSAEIYNQFAKFWNALTRMRLMLPIKFQTRNGTSQDVDVVQLYSADGTYRSCTTGAVLPGARNKLSARMPSAPSLGSWADDTEAVASYTMGIDDFACDGGGDWRLVHIRTDEQFKWSLEHDDYLEAVPPEWQDMIETNGELLGLRETQTDWHALNETTAGLGETCAGSSDYWSAGGVVDVFPALQTYTAECKLLPFSETLVSPLPPTGAIGVGRFVSFATLLYCDINASGSVKVTPIEADALIIRVELV